MDSHFKRNSNSFYVGKSKFAHFFCFLQHCEEWLHSKTLPLQSKLTCYVSKNSKYDFSKMAVCP